MRARFEDIAPTHYGGGICKASPKTIDQTPALNNFISQPDLRLFYQMETSFHQRPNL